MTGRTEPWYRGAFETEYLDVYAHRTDEAAAIEVDHVQRRWRLDRGARLLDLACGDGRHAAAWVRHGVTVLGVDLSRSLLSRATARRLDGATFVRADMSAIPCRRGFDAATSIFTSFGYFETDEENAAVLDEVARVLVPEGRFLLDFLNADLVRANLVAESRDERGDLDIVQRRRISDDDRRVEKTITITRGDETPRTTSESVRLYDQVDLERMLETAGIAVDAVCGGFDDSPFTPDAPRLVLTGRRR